MTAFYIAHDVASDVARLLREVGHDVVTVRELGTITAGDGYHVLRAAQAHRVLVSLNRRDYRLLHEAWLIWSAAWGTTAQHSGILLLPHGSPVATAQWITSFVSTATPIAGHCYECDRNGRWLMNISARGAR